MGCSQSSSAMTSETAPSKFEIKKSHDVLPLVSGTSNIHMKIGRNKNIQVCSMSKQNWYPNKTKPNQDAYMHKKFKAPDGSTVYLFAVLDGHGAAGHHASQWVAENLHSMIQQEVQKIALEGPNMSKESVQKACFDAHVACNNEALNHEKIDFEWSGTTCVSILVWTGGITVCNVGDSRAIIGEFVTAIDNRKTTNDDSGGNKRTLLAAEALSHDHIPLRKDERDRVKKAGAQVVTIVQAAGQQNIDEEENERKWNGCTAQMNQKEGENERIYTEDPPRIFAPGKMYPGYQFTRSFGDSAGKDLGIIAEPEISTSEFHSNIGLIVLATDGVYEYLTDQDVIDICALFPNPQDGCEAVIELAYKNWLDKDVRTDDITITCIHCNRENIDPLSLSMTSIKNSGQRCISEPSHDEKSGLPNFPNLTAECIKRYIKTGQISTADFSRVGLRSNESFLFRSTGLISEETGGRSASIDTDITVDLDDDIPTMD